MIRDAKTFTLSDTEETGDTSLCGVHKDSRHWKFECRREPHEAAQFLCRSLGLWHRRAGDDTPFEISSVTNTLLLVTTGHFHALRLSNDMLKVCRSPTAA